MASVVSSSEQFLASLKTKYSEWETAWKQRHDSVEDKVLYHYTNATGLLGIIDKQQLWASNAAFLNDSTELVYIHDALTEVLYDLKTTYVGGAEPDLRDSSSLRAHAMISVLETLLPSWPGTIFDVYVSCFCSDGDLLSQWRGYPSAGGGYALGLRAASLPHGRGLLRQVIYDPETQRQILHDLLSPILEAVASADYPTEDEGIDTLRSLLVDRMGPVTASIVECGFCFKHPGFKEESEWRLVILRSRDPKYRPNDPPPLIRATPTGLLPYLARSLEKDAIAKVIVGPGSEPTLAADAAVQLLANAGYENARSMVGHSEIPLRA